MGIIQFQFAGRSRSKLFNEYLWRLVMTGYKHIAITTILITMILMLQGCAVSKGVHDENISKTEDIATDDESEKVSKAEDIGDSNNEVPEIKDGYYGYKTQSGTRYSLGINIEGLRDYYVLSVLPANGGGTVIEGSITSEKDGSYTAKVNIDNSDILTGKSFLIIPTEEGVKVSSDDGDFNGITGVYPYVSDIWDDLEELFSAGEDNEVNDSLSDISGIEYVTEDGLGGELIVADNGTNYRFKLSLYRLTEIEGVAEESPDSGEVLDFMGTDASGEPISGTIKETDGGCVLTITDTTWEYLKNGDEFTFVRKDNALSDKYIYKDSDSCAMTEGDVELARRNLQEELPAGKSIEQMIVNEIYAKHGYKFKNAEIQAFFDRKRWYSSIENYTSDMDEIYNSLNDFEKKNIDFLQR